MSAKNKNVTIIGTGDLGKALAKRLITAGYVVHVGSRVPHKRNLSKSDEILGEALVESIEDSIRASSVIFLAVNIEHYTSVTIHKDLLAGKTIVDVSNRQKKTDGKSVAEELAAMLPDSKIVKGFNTMSAYAIGSDISGESKAVQICGDDADAKSQVQAVVRDMGFQCSDVGSLQMARELEAIPLYLFRGWGVATIVMSIIFIIWTTYIMINAYVVRSDYTLDRIPSYLINKAMGCTSVTLLALCYLPGCFAAFAQMVYGTKQKRFAKWLDRWMKMRKQLGLYALLFAAMHMILSVVVMTAGYLPFLFLNPTNKVAPTNETVTLITDSRMAWASELFILLGVLALALMVILGLTSIPAVGSLLNWREWICVQSNLGWICLIISIAHVTVRGAPGWHKTTFEVFVQRTNFLSLLLPWATLFLKIIIILPCISCYVMKIRRGWERGQSRKLADSSKGQNGKVRSGNGRVLDHVGYTNRTFDEDVERGIEKSSTQF